MALGISVKVKVPTEIKTAAKELPQFNIAATRLTSVLDAANITAQTLVVVGVFGVIVFGLILKQTWGNK
jgi:hypothetical protein